MVKVQTGDSSQTSNEADLITQTTNNIEEYPIWLVLAFALALGLALPSPLAVFGRWRERRAHRKEVDRLWQMLNASPGISTTKPEGNPSTDSGRSPTSP